MRKTIVTLTFATLLGACSPQADQSSPTANTDESNAVFSKPETLMETAQQDAFAYTTIAAACSANKFEDFLKVFASSPRIRKDFSADQVEVNLVGRAEKMKAADNYYFPLVWQNETWQSTSGFPIVLSLDAPAASNASVEWTHKPLDPTATFTEAQIKAIKEKGTLNFTFNQGCWRLVSDKRSHEK